MDVCSSEIEGRLCAQVEKMQRCNRNPLQMVVDKFDEWMIYVADDFVVQAPPPTAAA